MKLLDHPFFDNIPADQCEPLAKKTGVQSYRDGEIIFEEGSPPDELCLVLSGTVVFAKSTPDGKRRTISESTEGSFFGEVGIFTNSPRALTAIAKGNTVIGRVHRDQLVDFIKNTPGPIEQVLGSIVRHLHDTTRHYVDTMLHQEKMSLVGTMVNSIIHDFKNPFTMISLGAQLLEKRYPSDEKTVRICKSINEQVNRMIVMANELIEFSRGEQNIYFSKIALDDFSASFYRLNEPFFQNEKLKILLDVDPVEMEGEPNKLMRVLQNLVGNAIEAFEKDRSGWIRIAMKLHEGDKIQITVEDNAGGIPEQIRETFFMPFVTYGKSKGTGLGAAIAKSIIEAHHGSIRFTTETGKGTCFTIVVPRWQNQKMFV